MSELEPGVEQQITPEEGESKPVVFAVRLDPAFREQIEGLRGITGQSVNEVGTEALQDWVTKTLSDEEVRKKAMAQIDAEAERLQVRRDTISKILGESVASDETSKPAAEPGRPTSRRGKAAPSTSAE